MTQRSGQQNRALHKWFELKSQQCRDAGVTVQLAFNQTADLDMTPEMMKEIFRTIMKALYAKASTRDLEKVGEIDDMVNHLNRFFAERFGLEGIDLPSHELNYWNNAPMHEDAERTH